MKGATCVRVYAWCVFHGGLSQQSGKGTNLETKPAVCGGNRIMILGLRGSALPSVNINITLNSYSTTWASLIQDILADEADDAIYLKGRMRSWRRQWSGGERRKRVRNLSCCSSANVNGLPPFTLLVSKHVVPSLLHVGRLRHRPKATRENVAMPSKTQFRDVAITLTQPARTEMPIPAEQPAAAHPVDPAKLKKMRGLIIPHGSRREGNTIIDPGSERLHVDMGKHRTYGLNGKTNKRFKYPPREKLDVRRVDWDTQLTDYSPEEYHVYDQQLHLVTWRQTKQVHSSELLPTTPALQPQQSGYSPGSSRRRTVTRYEFGVGQNNKGRSLAESLSDAAPQGEFFGTPFQLTKEDALGLSIHELQPDDVVRSKDDVR